MWNEASRCSELRLPIREAAPRTDLGNRPPSALPDESAAAGLRTLPGLSQTSQISFLANQRSGSCDRTLSSRTILSSQQHR